MQEEEGLTLEKKIYVNHVHWQQHKMKVKYALQALSSSVANALEFLKTDLKHAEFENASATIVFVRTIDKIFDILNSRFAFAKSFKRPIRLQNLEYIEQTFAQAAVYLLSLKSSERQLLVFSRRKTFILGFLMTMKSIMSIAKELLTASERPFNYVLTYKFFPRPQRVAVCLYPRTRW